MNTFLLDINKFEEAVSETTPREHPPYEVVIGQY